jgi:hypothetical protein
MKLIFIFKRNGVEFHRREESSFDSVERAERYCSQLEKQYEKQSPQNSYECLVEIP